MTKKAKPESSKLKETNSSKLSAGKTDSGIKDSKTKKKTLKDLSFAHLLPNLATVAGLCTGLSSIRFAMMDRYEEAVIAIIIAAILDGVDGRIARLLKASSDFGA